MKVLGVLIPLYDGKICWQTMLRVRQEETALANAGWTVEPIIAAGCSAIHIVRNDLVQQAMTRGCDAVVFIDGDMDWDICGITRLLAHDVDVIGAAVPLKATPLTWNVGWIGKDFTKAPRTEQGLLQVSHVGTGLMVIRKRVFERLKKHLGDGYKYLSKTDGRECYAFFEAPIAWGEDARFCKHVNDAGMKVYVDPYIEMTHIIAPNWSVTARLSDWLEAQDPMGIAVESLRAKPCPESFKAVQEAWGNSIWSCTPDMLAACYDMARQAKGPIIECGSGISTFVMAISNPNVEIHALEHDKEWRSKIVTLLNRYSVTNATIHLTKIQDSPDGPFYDVSCLPEGRCGLCVLDGPPHLIANRNRAYEVLRDRIEGAPLLIDDTNNPFVQQGLEEYTAGKGGELAVYENEIKRWSIFIPREAVQEAA